MELQSLEGQMAYADSQNKSEYRKRLHEKIDELTGGSESTEQILRDMVLSDPQINLEIQIGKAFIQKIARIDKSSVIRKWTVGKIFQDIPNTDLAEIFDVDRASISEWKLSMEKNKFLEDVKYPVRLQNLEDINKKGWSQTQDVHARRDRCSHSLHPQALSYSIWTFNSNSTNA